MITQYPLMARQLSSLLENQYDFTAVLANAAALLNQALPNINWVGFYLLKNDSLQLGPFQGNVACFSIALNQGVCGKAFSTDTTQRIANVHEFEGHIACDSASQSELVIPIRVNGTLIGVLDIDSPQLDRFSIDDQLNIEKCVEVLSKHLGSCR